MNKLNKDELFSIAIQLDLPELLKFCGLNKRINELVYKRNDIWYYRLKKDFVEYLEWNVLEDIEEFKSVKDKYMFLYSLEDLNNRFKLGETLKDVYSLTLLDLSNEKLKQVPNAVKYLTNLEYLYLYSNQIKEIPESLGKLTSLQYLGFNYNQIKEIPESLGKLTNLQHLSLANNQIKEIPKSLGELTKLQSLSLRNNQIKEIPESLGKLTSLRSLSLHHNQIKEIPESLKHILPIIL